MQNACELYWSLMLWLLGLFYFIFFVSCCSQVQGEDPLHQQANDVLGPFFQAKEYVRHPSVVGVEPSTPLSPVPSSLLFPDPPRRRGEDAVPSPLVVPPNGMHKSLVKSEQHKHDKGAFGVMEEIRQSGNEMDAAVKTEKDEAKVAATSKHWKRSRGSGSHESSSTRRSVSSERDFSSRKRSRSSHGSSSSTSSNSKRSGSSSQDTARAPSDNQSSRSSESLSQSKRLGRHRSESGAQEAATEVFSPSKSQSTTSRKRGQHHQQQLQQHNGLQVNGMTKEHRDRLQKHPKPPKLVIKAKVSRLTSVACHVTAVWRS